MSRERGSVTAELAIAMPAVILLLACCLAGLQAGAMHMRLQDAAAQAARAAARSHSPDTTAALVAGELAPAASAAVRQHGMLLCVELSAPARIVGDLGLFAVTAGSCALSGGR